MKKVKKTTRKTKLPIKRKNARDGLPKPKGNPRRKGVVPKRPKLERTKAPAPRNVGPIDLMLEAVDEIAALAVEMRDWADNMENNFSHTQKYADVSEAADALEGIDAPSVEITALNDYKISWQDPTPRRRAYSRAQRAAHICDMLRAVEERMRNLEQELPEDDPQHDAASAFGDECENMINDLENVDFPGMF